jgi:Trk K+ transport system NAD-binding subunit
MSADATVLRPRERASVATGAQLGGHVVLFGVGTVGGEVMRRLRDAGIPVVAIDRAPGAAAQKLADQLGATLVRGDIHAPEVFAQLDVDRARSFISCTSDDKTNLELALAVHDLKPDLRIVVRLDNDNLGRQLEQRFPNWTVLGLPGLAAPAFVASALSPQAQRCWRIQDELLALVDVPVETPRLLRELPDVTALYVRRESGEVEHWPPPPTPLQPGDQLGVVVDVAQIDSLAGSSDVLAEAAAPGFLGRLGHRFANFIADADRRLLFSVALAIGIAWLSVFVFVEAKGLSLVSAIYFVVTTMATVGYGDINLLDDPPLLKLYGAGLMLTSLVVVSVLTAFVTNWVLSARLTRLFGSQRSTAVDHVIVCALGTVGYRVLQELRRVSPSTVGIDAGGTSSLSSEALQSGATVITGDARQPDAFRRANVDGARSIVVASSDDLANLEIALSAREANPRVRIVVRLFDEEFASRVRSTFDIDYALSPAALAAPAFAAAALGRSIADRLTIEGSEYLFVRMHVDPGSAWVGATIGDLLRGRNVVALAYQPAIGGVRIRPSLRVPLRPGDMVALICSPEAWADLEAEGPAVGGVSV